MKETRGITLIALVITIIVLLILAGVSIAMLTGSNGILTQANNAKIEQSHGAVKDSIALLYNEYQIQINTGSTTKLASTETVSIPANEEKALVNTSMTFLDFLKGGNEQKINYIKQDTDNVLDVEVLTGSSQALGNGTDTDVYKIEEQDDSYVVNYYDKNNNPKQIWSIANSTETGGLELEPDTGKEALILVYNVSAGDEIELPYYLTWYDEDNEYDATFNFTVDWGDGSTTEDITNSNIGMKSIHRYTEAGEMKVKITGTYEVLFSNSYPGPSGIYSLTKIEQWGTTELKYVGLNGAPRLTKIAEPTENSFKDLVHVEFASSGIQSIPENLFANCPNLTDFSSTFTYTDITSIPENLFANCPNVSDFSFTFANTDITSIPENLFANCPNVSDFSFTFSDTDITSIPENLFANCKNVANFESCFSGCHELVENAPELWLRIEDGEENGYIGIPDGKSCFYGCDGLGNYEEIPDYWKATPPPK